MAYYLPPNKRKGNTFNSNDYVFTETTLTENQADALYLSKSIGNELEVKTSQINFSNGETVINGDVVLGDNQKFNIVGDNVGINTDNPIYQLDVNGDVSCDDLYFGSGISLQDKLISIENAEIEVDLTNYYTKQETYNKDETNNLVDAQVGFATDTINNTLTLNYYNKLTTDNLLDDKVDTTALDNYYDKTSTDTLLNDKVDTTTLTTNYDTSAEVDFKIANASTGASGSQTYNNITETTDAVVIDGTLRADELYVGESAASGARIYMSGGAANDANFLDSVIETRQYGGEDNSEMILFKGNDGSPDSNKDRIRLRAGEIALDCFGGANRDRETENIQFTIDDSSCNIEVDTTINGTLQVDNITSTGDNVCLHKKLYKTYSFLHARSDEDNDNWFQKNNADNNLIFDEKENFNYVEIPDFSGDILYSHNIHETSNVNFYQFSLRDLQGNEIDLVQDTLYTINTYYIPVIVRPTKLRCDELQVDNITSTGDNICLHKKLYKTYTSIYHHRSDGNYDNLLTRLYNADDNNAMYDERANFNYVDIPDFSGDTLYSHKMSIYNGSYYQFGLRTLDGEEIELSSNTFYTINTYYIPAIVNPTKLICDDIVVNNKKTYFWKVSNQTFSFADQGDQNPKDVGGYIKFSIPNADWNYIPDDALIKITIHGTMKLKGTGYDSYFFLLNALHHTPHNNWVGGYLKRTGFALHDLRYDDSEQLAVRYNDVLYARTLPNFPFIYITTKSLLVDYALTHNSNYENNIVSGTEPFDFYFTVGKNLYFGDVLVNTNDDILCEEMDIIIEVDGSSANAYQGTLSVVDLHDDEIS